MPRPSLILCVLLLCSAAARGQQPAATAPTTAAHVLTTAAEVRQLTPEQAALKHPVHLRGVVTYVVGTPPLLFVQDHTGGVCISGQRDKELRQQVRPGVTVELYGVTAPGRVHPYVTSPGKEPLAVEIIGDGPPPKPRPLTVAQLTDPANHEMLVEVEGVVRSVAVETVGPATLDAMVLTLRSGNDRLEAVMVGRFLEQPQHLVGAQVRLRGVFNSAAPERQQSTGMRLLLQAMRDLKVIQQAEAPFSLPVTGVAALNAAAVAEPLPTRVRVQGVVTLPIPGKGLYVQDGEAGVWIDTPAAADRTAELQPGSRIDVVGFPSRRGWAVMLEDAAWRMGERTPLPEAPLVNADQALAGTMDGQRVRMDALVLEVSRLAEGPTLVLQSGERVFLARLVGTAAQTAGIAASVRENTWVRVTGICVNNRSPGDPPDAAMALNAGRPISFHLLLGAEDAVDVIRTPNWWTARRVLAIAGGLSLVALLAFIWVIALRRRVARQTAQIRDHVGRQSQYEERVRIARELHDSLEQDLLGITMQLNATEKLLGQPDKAKQSLALASAMVRRSQAETHRAVWDLREQRHGPDGLPVTLREAVAGLSPQVAAGGLGPKVEVKVQGDPRPLPPAVQNHVLRVAQEAVTNAIKHAGATRVDVELSFTEAGTELKVRDDGRGFDPAAAPPPSRGHFGLFGMRERAEKLHAGLTIRSSAGQGTEVRLVVPVESGNGAPETGIAKSEDAVADRV